MKGELKIKILHLCSYYIGNNLYNEMFKTFGNIEEVESFVMVPLKKTYEKDVNKVDKTNIHLFSDKIFSLYDRINFYSKKNKYIKMINNYIKLDSINMVHTHSLFSDGIVGYEISKKFDIPYIVTVRNTDINYFFKYQKHLKNRVLHTLLSAKQVIFLSNNYLDYLLKYIPKEYHKNIIKKSLIIPNGVSNFWKINAIKNGRNDVDKVRDLLFIGTLNKNKNILNLIKKIEKYPEYHLDIIGDGPLLDKVRNYIDNNSLNNRIKIHGNLSKENILNLMQKSDVFILPSITETFGIVYLEAMSQGLPVIYTKGQGFDGYFEEGKVGYSIESSLDNLSKIIKKIEKNYNGLSNNCAEEIENFQWENIVQKYLNVYLSNIK
ncbi:glycosyltransferase [Macrococcoides goetzii]|nr:glycosyltransferase family 4 protein [Macrococcus goetzii]TDM46085.1 glycosyltransferase [Macrococcus goetzii]